MKNAWKRWSAYILALALLVSLTPSGRAFSATAVDDVEATVKAAFQARADALLHNGDPGTLTVHYGQANAEGRSIVASRLLAYEQDKIREFHKYAADRGMKYTDVKMNLTFKDTEVNGNRARTRVVEYLTLSYVYPKSPNPTVVNTFSLGMKHDMELILAGNRWLIYRDDYIDSFRTWLGPDHITPRTAPPATGLDRVPTKPSGEVGVMASYTWNGNQAAVYAEKYCGVPGCGNNLQHNSTYADEPDDCTNFVSQALGDPTEGGGAPQSSTRNYSTDWYYDYPTKTGSIAWVRAHSFVNFLINRNYAVLYAKGNHAYVTQQPADYVWHMYKGDVFGYDWPSPSYPYNPDGTVDHMSIVVGFDSSNYPKVDTHNDDRWHAPWDLGHTNDNTTFWLVRMNGVITTS